MAENQVSSVPRSLYLKLDSKDEKLAAVLHALAFKTRLRILELLSDRLYNVTELAQALELPLSTTSNHISILERAGLLLTEQRAAARGTQRACTRAFDTVVLQLPEHLDEVRTMVEESMPIGAYVDCSAIPTCGLLSERGVIGFFDDPRSFYDPRRIDAQLLWFHRGYVEYRFPQRLPAAAKILSLTLSFEACSEAPLHHDDWLSDVSVWINGVELGTWTSPADFGGSQGKLTPTWWEKHNTQYGLLKIWRVDDSGCVLDGITVSSVSQGDLRIQDSDFISVRIGIKDEAQNVGGLNLFGSRFGNHPQDLLLRIQYSHVD